MAGIDSNTLLMLHLNNNVIDVAQYGLTIINNDVTFSNSSPEFAGTYYSVFDGINDYLSVPDNVALELTSGDFTIDFWVNFISLPTSGNGMYLCCKRSSGSVNTYQISVNNITGNIHLIAQVTKAGVTTQDNITFSFNLNQWYHIAYINNSQDYGIYVNGTRQQHASVPGFFPGTTSTILTIGAFNSAGGSIANFLNGQISEFRISNIARWSGASFTPPTSPYTVPSPSYPIKVNTSNSHILVNNSNHIIINS